MPDITLMPILVILCVLFFALPLYAETTDDAREELRGTITQIKESDARQKAFEEKNAALERELRILQQQMVALAGEAAKREEELASYEEKLDILEEQKQTKTRAFNARQAELSTMISAMIKLRQLPPEAVIAMPGKLDETLETARALGVVSNAIEEEAESLKAQLHELDALEDKIRQNREAIADKKAVLTARQEQLAGKVKARAKLQAALGGKERQEKERAARLMAKSRSLQDLLDSLERSEHDYAWEREAGNTAAKKHGKYRAGHTALRSFVDAKGRLRLPPGRIVSHFGNTGAGTAFSKGVVIETRAEAGVVAPYDGEVVFAGPFRDYGRMVILRHSDDYHTLLAGMNSLNCTPGQFLLEGEPIGTMGARAGASRLYMELRNKEGKPVDPLPWFGGTAPRRAFR